ncbi:hypothetical protein B0I35DRAFT_439973 [Stachybotrys elegans]|uniref:Pentatricopeptide repeat domain-containing protein n=1 Tax=Stachybotrys elegans TaxID=80388 RepID=A0A8K0SIX7_9HYPO|nr:hypothetical protein B0I35DRAFT_439973 [Stachybotrys elegans]
MLSPRIRSRLVTTRFAQRRSYPALDGVRRAHAGLATRSKPSFWQPSGIEIYTKPVHDRLQLSPPSRSLSVVDLNDPNGWTLQLLSAYRANDDEGLWKVFERLCDQDKLDVLTLADTGFFREMILSVAAGNEARLNQLVRAAQHLVEKRDFTWPHLYAQTIHILLERSMYKNVPTWHERLATTFPPDNDALGELIAHHVTDPTPDLQSVLRGIYIFYSKFSTRPYHLYDAIVPELFSSGDIELTQTWRRLLVLSNDRPLSSKSLPFLRYSSAFHRWDVTDEERGLLNGGSSRMADAEPSEQSNSRGASRYSDATVAKLFATKWMPVELVMNLARNFGISSIGPLALQSLALRQPDQESVKAILEHLKSRNMEVEPRNYSKALIDFAMRADETLLTDLLQSDIHPDVFDDMDTVEQLVSSYTTQQTYVGPDGAPSFRVLHAFRTIMKGESEIGVQDALKDAIRRTATGYRRSYTEVKTLLDLMEAREVSITQENADELLGYLLKRLPIHRPPPSHLVRNREPEVSDKDRCRRLSDIVSVGRRLLRHEVAIPIKFWKVVLAALGRWNRIEQVAQLSLEITQWYKPTSGGLIPVHPEDMPGVQNSTREACFIPSGLSLRNAQHPVRKLFDTKFQRRVVRWGFDHTVVHPQHPTSVMEADPFFIRSYDIACGVRILALLRDEGVNIDSKVVRMAVLMRMAVVDFTQRQGPSRDSHAMSPHVLKDLVDGAWGSDLLPEGEKLDAALDEVKPKVWKNYSDPRALEGQGGTHA